MKSFREKVDENWSKESEKQSMTFFFYLPSSSGIVPHLRGNWFYVGIAQYFTFLILCMVSACQLLYTTYLMKDLLSVAALTLHIAGAQIFCISVLLIALKRKVIVDNWNTMLNNYYDYGPSFRGESKPWVLEASKVKNRTFMLYLVMFSITGLQVIILGPIQDKMQGFSYNATFINGVYMLSPYPIYFPFAPSYLFAFFYEMLLFAIVIVDLCAAIILILFVSDSVTYQLRVLRESIENLEKRTLNLCHERYQGFPTYKKRTHLYHDSRFIRVYEKCIGQNIEHHKIILKYLFYPLEKKCILFFSPRVRDNLDYLLRWAMFTIVLFIAIIIACSLFIIIKGENRVSSLVFSLMLFALEIITLTLICKRGQDIIDEGDKLYRAFYTTTHWFHCPLQIKKLMLVITERNKRPLSYKAGGLIDIDWVLYSSIMNSAYSYLNLMLAMKD